MTSRIFTTLSFLLLLLAIVLFLFSCYATASDAQGTLNFIFLGPVILFFPCTSVLADWRARRLDAGSRKVLISIGTVMLIFFMLFVVCAFIPPLWGVTNGVIGAVA